MSVNSISPRQPARSSEVSKKIEIAIERKQSEVQGVSTGQDRKVAAAHQSQTQKAPEPSKPVVNTSGQKIGSHINISA
jgi:hypothetical protein